MQGKHFMNTMKTELLWNCEW